MWHDLDRDGLQDTCEPGWAGVTVTLLDGGGTPVGTTVTGADGLYEFTGLAPGTYALRFEAPDSFAFTVQTAGADPTLDSDPDPVTGEIDPFTLGAGGVDRSLDAGLVGGPLAIHKTPDLQLLLNGEFAEFTLEVVNAGSADLSDVTLSDPLTPDCDAQIGLLAAGDRVTYDCAAEVVLPCGFTNVATVTAADGSGNELTATDHAEVARCGGFAPDEPPVSAGGSTGPGDPGPGVPGSASAPASAATPQALLLQQARSLTRGDLAPGNSTPCEFGEGEGERPVRFVIRCLELEEDEWFFFVLVVSRAPDDGSGGDPGGGSIPVETGSRMRAELSFIQDRVQVAPKDWPVDPDGTAEVRVDVIEGRGTIFEFGVRPTEPREEEGRLTLSAEDALNPGIETLLADAVVTLSVEPASVPPEVEAQAGGPGPGAGGPGSEFPLWVITAAVAAIVFLGGGVAARRRLWWAMPAGRAPAPGGGAVAAATGATAVAVAASDEPRAFISYSRRDSRKVFAIQRALEEAGLDTWLDTGDITGGQTWKAEIVRGLRSAHAVILILSPNSVTSRHVAKELSYGSEQHKPVVPVHLAADVEVTDELAYDLTGVQHINLHEDFKRGIAEIVAAVNELAASPSSDSPTDPAD